MKRSTARIVFSGLLIVALLASVSFGWPTINECRPQGTLTYLGAPAPVGTRLQAKIDGITVAETTVVITGRYAFDIPSDNDQTIARDGWSPEDIITIWAGNYEAKPVFTAFSGTKEINLTATAISLDVRKSTWGKIKALFR